MTSPGRRRRYTVAGLAATTALAGLAALGGIPAAQAAPGGAHRDFNATRHQLQSVGSSDELDTSAAPSPRALPAKGRSAFLLQLDVASTTQAFRNKGAKGPDAASAARSQLTAVRSAQNAVIAKLPASTPVLYRTHALLAGVAVTTDVKNVDALAKIAGVSRVMAITPKTHSNSYAVPLQGAPAVWTGGGGVAGNTGAGTTIAVIDTGIDYTHANFGGAGTVAAYDAADAVDTAAPATGTFDAAKFADGVGVDLVGDAYNANVAGSTPVPDPNPLDCEGHGSHVAGSATGFGVTGAGATYTGGYSSTTPFSSLRIGPGMAPGATLYAIRVFGCAGSTNVVSEALDAAADPNGDGNPADHVDVVNMSLGSSFGSPDDADAVVSDAAVQAGISVVASAGNAYDVQDVSGSPANATRAISVASTTDASSVLDSLNVTIGGTATSYGSVRSVAYDYSSGDLTGQVVLPPANNLTGCTAYPAGTFTATQVVLLKWTQEALECGSVTRSTNLRNAGAGGFIFGNSQEFISGGITGSAVIPGVLVTKSGGDAIRAALSATPPVPVIALGTTAATFTQTLPEFNDRVSDFSSRGIHAEDHLKPDVAAVGATVFSTSNGTGNQGEVESGTSMASPMTAGLSALIRTAHPDWTPAQVKADIMNTAGQDLFVNGSAAGTGGKYAPNRVGSGRIQAVPALATKVLAYNADGSGAVSVSFGPVAATAALTRTKTVTLQNTGATAASYALSYDPVTEVPGTSFTVTPATVSIPAGGTSTATVTFKVTDVSAMTKTADATSGRTSTANVGTATNPVYLPKDLLSSASGRMLATSSGAPTLRVPVYAAPRPASAMTQAGSVGLTTGADQTGSLTLTGSDLGQGTTNGSGGTDTSAAINSLAAGFELSAVSGKVPGCSGVPADDDLCVRSAAERDADLKYVGVTSDYPYAGTGPNAFPQAYFAVTSHAAVPTPASRNEYDVYIDADGDHFPDVVAYNSRLGTDDHPEDVFVSKLVDLSTGAVIDQELIDNRLGDTDAAVFDSDSMILPVGIPVLQDYGLDPATNPRINYGINSYTYSGTGQRVDAVGIGEDGFLSLGANVYKPGISVVDSTGVGPLVADTDGSTLTVKRNAAAYAADRGLGLLMLHLHNQNGSKAQVVSVGQVSTTTLSITPATIVRGDQITVTMKVSGPDGGPTPTGQVSLVGVATGAPVATLTLDDSGQASYSGRPSKPGIYNVKAVYAGDETFAGSSSAPFVLTVMKATPVLTAKTGTPTRKVGQPVNVAVTIPTVKGIKPTGTVVLKRGGVTVATGTLNNNKAVLTFTPKSAGTYSLVVSYAGDATYKTGTSNTVTVKVTPKS